MLFPIQSLPSFPSSTAFISSVILAHGVTDVLQDQRDGKNFQYLFTSYASAASFPFLLDTQQNVILFLIASSIHFSKDFRFLNRFPGIPGIPTLASFSFVFLCAREQLFIMMGTYLALHSMMHYHSHNILLETKRRLFATFLSMVWLAMRIPISRHALSTAPLFLMSLSNGHVFYSLAASNSSKREVTEEKH